MADDVVSVEVHKGYVTDALEDATGNIQTVLPEQVALQGFGPEMTVSYSGDITSIDIGSAAGDPNRNTPRSATNPRTVLGYTRMNVSTSNAFTYFNFVFLIITIIYRKVYD